MINRGRRMDPRWSSCCAARNRLEAEGAYVEHYNRYYPTDAQYNYGTTDGPTTTEDATEYTDAQNVPNQAPQQSMPLPCRDPRNCEQARYYYPVLKKRSRRNYVPYAYYAHVQNHIQDPRMYCRDRRRTRRTVHSNQHKHRCNHTLTTQAIPDAPVVENKQNVPLHRNAIPAHGEGYQYAVKGNLRKRSSKRVFSMGNQAVDSSTSVDGKSNRSTYSRLSIDVTNEMVAMNHDIENILSRYESVFDQTTVNELEERGLSSKNHSRNENSKRSCAHRIPSRERSLFKMEKPPLDRLGEIPFEMLKPRPPGVKNVNKTDGFPITVKHLLQDLVSRGIMNTLDDASFQKLQTILSKETIRNVTEQTASQQMASSPDKYSTQFEGESGRKNDANGRRLGEATILSDLDVQPMVEPIGARVASIPSPRAASKLPNLVDRKEGFIPVDSVNSDKNWRRNLKELERKIQNSHCEQCKLMTEQLMNCPLYTPKVDKSVNTDQSQEVLEPVAARRSTINEDTAKEEPIEGATNWNETQQANVIDLMKSSSNTTSITNRTEFSSETTNSGQTTYICEQFERIKDETKLSAEDVGDEERPLQRVQETTNFGQELLGAKKRGRPYKPSAVKKMDSVSYNDSAASASAKDEGQAGGDSTKTETSFRKEELLQIVDKISVDQGLFKTTEVNTKLEELNSKISENASNLDQDTCLNIIRKLTEVMLTYEPVLGDLDIKSYCGLIDKDSSSYTFDLFKRVRRYHLYHLLNEIGHLKSVERTLSKLCNSEGYVMLEESKIFGTDAYSVPSPDQ